MNLETSYYLPQTVLDKTGLLISDHYIKPFSDFVVFVCLFVFVALRPMSTAMVIAGQSVHLTTLFPGQA